MINKNRMKKVGLRAVYCASAVLMVMLCVVGVLDALVPNRVTLYRGEDVHAVGMPDFVTLDGTYDGGESVAVSAYRGVSPSIYTEREATARLFGVIPLKSVTVGTLERVSLYPGGMPFGVKLYTDGVLVVGVASVECDGGECTPAGDSGIRTKDVITHIDGIRVNTVDEVTRLLEGSEGRTLTVTVRRSGESVGLELTPILSADGAYRAGLWIRDSTAGIGTVTYIDPKTGEFGGLGHGICDVDTGELMPLGTAGIVDVELCSVTKGRVGSPGELKGCFENETVGALTANTESGVFGILAELPDTMISEALPVALGREVEEGRASILTTIPTEDGSPPCVREYRAEITKLRDGSSPQKNFVIKVTDKELLEATGGIVQGMSGSTIIQNGKIVGAVTHVLVNDPTSGYGIFIENMLDAAA